MSEQALTKIEPMPVSPTVEAMLVLAIERGATVETLERLMAIRREVRAEQAKEAYDRAMAAFQSECPTIEKTKGVKTDSGALAYKYAPIECIIAQVKELLKKHGFSYSTKMELMEKGVKAIVKVTHEAGHSEESPMEVPFGSKTKIMSDSQVAAAASTFAKRYAFCNAFGILTGDEDIDGRVEKPGNSQTTQRQPTTSTPRGNSTGTPSKPAQKPAEPPQATEKTRSWFLVEMRKRFNDETLLRWGKGRSDPATIADFDDGIDDWPLHQVPTTKDDLHAMILECADFTGVEPLPQRSAEPPQKPAAPAKASEPAHHSEDWYNFPMGWGKNAGTILGKLQKNYLYGLWKNYAVETEYNGKPKKKETIEADRQFRVMLDKAGIHYKFDEPKGSSDEADVEPDAGEEMPF